MQEHPPWMKRSARRYSKLSYILQNVPKQQTCRRLPYRARLTEQEQLKKENLIYSKEDTTAMEFKIPIWTGFCSPHPHKPRMEPFRREIVPQKDRG